MRLNIADMAHAAQRKTGIAGSEAGHYFTYLASFLLPSNSQNVSTYNS
jgi:hypothetical protein